MTAIIRFSLHHAKLVAAAALAFLVLGALWARDISIDVFPTLAPTQISIVTQAPGMVSEQVEQLVTRPVEYATLGAEGIASVHSVSSQGVSVVEATLQAGSDPERTRDALTARLTLANSDLPEGAGPALLASLATTSSDVLQIGLAAPGMPSAQLRDIAQWTIRPRLLATPGVSRVEIFGGDVRRIEVSARSGDLSDSDLGFADVVDAVHRATSVRGAGFIDTPNQRVMIDPHGQALTAKDVEAGQIHVTGGAPVRIGDVSDVAETTWPANNGGLIDGQPGVLLAVGGQLNTTMVGATRKIDASLAPLRSALANQGVTIHADVGRPADFIVQAVRDVALDLLIGVFLILILLVFLLHDFRAALISFVTIPLGLLAALMTLKLLGWTVNIMTIGGLVVALGLIADDAVLDVENIIADLRQAEIQHHGRARAILLASLEVRAPVIYATLIIVAALAPIILLGGPVGALLTPLATVIIVGCLAAIVIALTVTPALSLLFLNHLSPAVRPRWLDALKDGYHRQLQAISRRQRIWFLASAAIVGVALIAACFFKTDILPPIHDGTLVVDYDAPTATSLAAMQDYGMRITAVLLNNPDIAHVYQHAGRPDFGSTASAIEHGEIDIALAPGLSIRRQEMLQSYVRSVMASYAGLSASVRTRLVSQRFGPQDSAGASVKIYGEDLSSLDQVAKQVAAILRTYTNAGPVKVQAEGLGPVIRVDLNFQRLALYGLSSADVLGTVQTAFQGTTAARIFNNGREIDIAVTAEANVRRDPEAIGDLLIRSSQGISAPLKYVANVYLTEGRTAIAHDNGVRRQVVTFEPTGDVKKLLADVRNQVQQRVKLPPGTYLEYIMPVNAGPPFSLLVDIGFSSFAIWAILFVLYADARVTVFILGSTIFSVVGGILAVALMGGVLTLGAFMGFVVLLGISARNAILLVSQVRTALHRPDTSWSAATVFDAARERFSSILVSAIIVAAGLLPIALRAGDAGMEILGPMVFAILGGLCTSALMSLFLSPLTIIWVWRNAKFLPHRPRQA